MGTETPSLRHPHTTLDMLVLKLWADLKSAFPLWPRWQHPWFPKTIYNVDSSHHRTLLNFASIPNELEPREITCITGCCWYMAFTLHGRVLTCMCTKRFTLTFALWKIEGFRNSMLVAACHLLSCTQDFHFPDKLWFIFVNESQLVKKIEIWLTGH